MGEFRAMWLESTSVLQRELPLNMACSVIFLKHDSLLTVADSHNLSIVELFISQNTMCIVATKTP